MITDRQQALNVAAQQVCVGRSDDVNDAEDLLNARADALAVLDAIGYDELIASRERAIGLAVAFESTVEKVIEEMASRGIVVALMFEAEPEGAGK